MREGASGTEKQQCDVGRGEKGEGGGEGGSLWNRETAM